jgi:hypothetical protein
VSSATAVVGRCDRRTQDVDTMSDKRDIGCLPLSAEGGESDQMLVKLAEELSGAFPPVQPELVFRQRLHDDLLATMRLRETMRIAFPKEQRRWALIAGATVGSLVPIAGVAAYLVRSRLAGRPQHATSS